MELHSRGKVTPLKPEPAALWSEYGLQEAEKAEYTGAKGRFTVSAWRLPDATAGLAALQVLRGSRPTGATIQQLGNYVLQFEGFTPEEETLNQLRLHIPRFDNSSLPALTGFLPAAARHGNSERYILGPASLEAFLPGLAPSIVAFHYGTEGQLARYKDRDGNVTLALFNYPTNQIAKERIAAFEALKGFTARRYGPMIGVVPNPPSADAAERILSQVRWEINVTVNEQLPDPKQDNIGVVVINTFIFVGILIFFALLSGGAFAGFRLLGRKISGQKDGDDTGVIALHIDDSPGK